MSKILEKLMNIQQELIAPKENVNTFGGYNYRNCNDILVAVKPLLKKYECTLIIIDGLEECAGKPYISATAVLSDVKGESHDRLSSTAYARETIEKKKFDESQLTGTASSYARKYALNGLFCIDDMKDADSHTSNSKPSSSAQGRVTPRKDIKPTGNPPVAPERDIHAYRRKVHESLLETFSGDTVSVRGWLAKKGLASVSGAKESELDAIVSELEGK